MNDTNVKIEQNKGKGSKWWVYLIAFLPIVLGTALYVSNCATTPNYFQIFNGQSVSTEDSNEKVYSLNDSYGVVSTQLETNSDGDYLNYWQKDETLFKVNLATLNSLNTGTNKLMIKFYFQAKSGIASCNTRLTFPKLGANVDGSIVESVKLVNETFTTYLMTEIDIKNKQEMTLSVVSEGTTTGCETASIGQFKNIRLKVFGAN